MKGSFLFILICIAVYPLEGEAYQIVEDSARASQLMQKGTELGQSNDFQGAIQYLDSAATVFERLELWDEFLQCQHMIGYHLSNLTKHEEAVLRMKEVEAAYAHRLDPEYKGTYGLYWQLAWSEFSSTQYVNALDYYDKTRKSIESGGHQLESAQQIMLEYQVGVIYQRIDQFDFASKYMQKVLALSDQYRNDLWRTNALNNLGIINSNIGEYELAMNYYEKAYEMSLASFLNSGRNLAGLTPFFVSIGYQHHKLGRYETAIEVFDEGIKMYNDNYPDWFPVLSTLTFNKGLSLIELGRVEEAKSLIQDMHNVAISSGPLSPGNAFGFTYLGLVERALGNYDVAIEYFQKHLDVIESRYPRKNGVLPDIYKEIADTHFRNGDYPRALQVVQKSLVTLSAGFEDSLNYHSNPHEDEYFLDELTALHFLETKAIYLEAEWQATGDESLLHSAFESNRLARHLMDKLRQNLFYQSSQITLAEKSQSIFEFGIKLNAILFDITEDDLYQAELFKCFEGNRSYLISQAIQESKYRGYSVVPDSIFDRESLINQKMAAIEGQLFTISDTIKVRDLKDSLFVLKESYTALQSAKNELIRSNDAFWMLPSLPEFQENLPSGLVIYEYFAGEDEYHLLKISKDKVGYHKIGSIEEVDGLVNQLISDNNQIELPLYLKVGMELGKLLQITNDLSSLSDQIVIVPDGGLSFVPFDALPVSEGTNFKNIGYLLEETSIRLHYSSGLFYAINQIDSESDQASFLGYAPDFDLNNDKLVATRGSSDKYPTNLAKLPGAKEEVMHGANIFNGVAKIGFDAQESDFKTKSQGYERVHIASHTVLNYERPLYSTLVFAKDTTGLEDGLLHLYELFDLKLSNKLVSLSSCDTGVGRSYKGEGVMSLAKGFMAAGVQNLMMSLWAVPDASTSKIMQSFYQYIADGKTDHQALRMAKIDYLNAADEITAHPYYWATFVYVGRGEDESGNKIFTYLIPIFLVIFIVVNRQRRRMSRSTSSARSE